MENNYIKNEELRNQYVKDMKIALIQNDQWERSADEIGSYFYEGKGFHVDLGAVWSSVGRLDVPAEPSQVGDFKIFQKVAEQIGYKVTLDPNGNGAEGYILKVA